ncbi:glycosyltransferase family 2 protein [Tabrizicola sp. J26]|uniref:glycosyltransferase family 2 protein n=1 Tax=Alitabrizicola rongguiensis TaxID=2909234 RepID=UPI001F4331B3|nr:glycosyltransferase family 2 protein [Tabrizicola rongguiensis]MCF1708456.1 glycosyltransferase family 2 protein [Tabrizicola rongguiensis]
MRHLAILCVRNEAAFLIEWLAHHHAIGFTDFMVFSNDCQDGTDALLDRLQALGHLTHIRNDRPGQRGPQWSALKLAEDHALRRSADWIMVLDIDEFVNIRAGDGTLAALHAALPEATAIPLAWRLFGNAGEVEIADRLVTERFTRAAPSVLWWPWRAALFKTLFRNDGTYARLGVHRPRDPDPKRLAGSRWFDGSGRELGEGFRTNRLYADYGRDNYRLAQLNHYALGSAQDFILKGDRGRANREASAADAGYWIERNFSSDEDRSVLRTAPLSAPLRAELLADPVLGPLNRAAIQWRRSRFAVLMKDEAMRALYGRLLLSGPSQPLDEEQARTIWRLAQNQ